VQLNNLN